MPFIKKLQKPRQTRKEGIIFIFHVSFLLNFSLLYMFQKNAHKNFLNSMGLEAIMKLDVLI